MLLDGDRLHLFAAVSPVHGIDCPSLLLVLPFCFFVLFPFYPSTWCAAVSIETNTVLFFSRSSISVVLFALSLLDGLLDAAIQAFPLLIVTVSYLQGQVDLEDPSCGPPSSLLQLPIWPKLPAGEPSTSHVDALAQRDAHQRY